MLAETLIDTTPQWIGRPGPDADVVVLSQCTLLRNLSDLPFPSRCSEEERRQLRERVQQVLDSLNLLASGTFHDVEALSTRDLQLLAERRLVTTEFLEAPGPRGLYVAEDQGLAIMVNGSDHLSLRAVVGGAQIQEAWARLNLLDDTLSGMLDFAYDARLGYLTSELSRVGTGLVSSAIVHLPCLTQRASLPELGPASIGQRLNLRSMRVGVDDPRLIARLTGSSGRLKDVETRRELVRDALYSDTAGAVAGVSLDTVGDLYLVVNETTLGAAEEEQVFHLRQVLTDLVQQERAARQELQIKQPRHLEDQVGRALGLAGGARLLPFSESLHLLSALRLGAASGLLGRTGIDGLNELMLRAQWSHLEAAAGQPANDLTLSTERADLFRARLGATDS